MSYCKNCGEKIEDGQFCTKCGTAVPTSDTYVVISKQYSPYYQQISAYYDKARALFTLGLLSLIFPIILGFIFEFIYTIISARMKAFPINVNLSNYPEEQEMLRKALKKHKAGVVMYSIALVITWLLGGCFIVWFLIVWPFFFL